MGAATVETEAPILKTYYGRNAHGMDPKMMNAMKAKGMIGKKKKKKAPEQKSKTALTPNAPDKTDTYGY